MITGPVCAVITRTAYTTNFSAPEQKNVLKKHNRAREIYGKINRDYIGAGRRFRVIALTLLRRGKFKNSAQKRALYNTGTYRPILGL